MLQNGRRPGVIANAHGAHADHHRGGVDHQWLTTRTDQLTTAVLLLEGDALLLPLQQAFPATEAEADAENAGETEHKNEHDKGDEEVWLEANNAVGFFDFCKKGEK